MKNLLGLLLIVTLFTFTSCGGDDDCTTDSFVGVFSGTIDCGDDGEAEGTLTITKVSETQITVDDGDGGVFTVDVIDCVGTYAEGLAGFGSTELTLTLDGDKLKYDQTATALGFTVSCSGELERG